MTFFTATSNGVGLDMGSETNRAKFKQFLLENKGIRLKIEPVTPESRGQRAFFEGAIVPLFCYYQENMDYKNPDHLKKVREWLSLEFNSELVNVGGKVHKVAKSTKGQLNKGFIDRVMDYMADNGYQIDTLDPNNYKVWRDTIYPFGGADNYIDYLVSVGRLK